MAFTRSMSDFWVLNVSPKIVTLKRFFYGWIFHALYTDFENAAAMQHFWTVWKVLDCLGARPRAFGREINRHAHTITPPPVCESSKCASRVPHTARVSQSFTRGSRTTSERPPHYHTPTRATRGARGRALGLRAARPAHNGDMSCAPRPVIADWYAPAIHNFTFSFNINCITFVSILQIAIATAFAVALAIAGIGHRRAHRPRRRLADPIEDPVARRPPAC